MTNTVRNRIVSVTTLLASALLLGPSLAQAQTPPPSEPPPEATPAPPPPPTPPPPAPGIPVETANKGKVTIKGFVSATIFAQDATFIFGDGQNAQFPVPILPAGEKPDDPWFIDGDVRNTRLNLSWDGPTDPALPKVGATLEVDFFGGTPGGNFGNAQPLPRLRIATAQIALGTMTLKIGQDWAPLFGNVPVSLAHMAFPLGYGSAGVIGWRFIGAWLIIPFTPKEAELQAKVTLAILRNSWGGVAAFNPPNLGSAGIPQLEGRVDVGTKMVNAYLVGHVDVKDLDGVGEAAMNDPGNLTAFAIEAGAKVTAGPLMAQANGYFGKAIGHQFGNLTQFGDISGFGAWGQLGYDITPQFGIFGFFGVDIPDEDDVRAAVPIVTMPTPTAPAALPRLQNLQGAAMVRYKAGPYQLGLEYMFDQLTFAPDATTDESVSANQIAVSANYAF